MDAHIIEDLTIIVNYPNRNNSQDPVFLEREKLFTKPIKFSIDSNPITKKDYIKRVAVYGVHGKYAILMAERFFSMPVSQ